MQESWRWFGPSDPVTIDEIRQTGVTDIVSALHDIPAGEIWPIDAIRAHKTLIEDCEDGLAPLKWTVVESIPVHEDIKLARPVMKNILRLGQYRWKILPNAKLKQFAIILCLSLIGRERI